MSKRQKCAAAEIIAVPTEGEAARFGAMIYLAVLAYPLLKEAAQRRALVKHMMLWQAKIAVRNNPSLRARMPPKLTWTRLRKHEEMLLTDAAFERVRKRLWAGQIAFRQWVSGQQVGPYVLNIRNSTTAAVYRELKPWSLDDLHREGRQDHHGVANFGKRVWLAAMPVLHLALVFPQDKDGYRDSFDLVHKPDWLPDALKLAEAYRFALGEKIPSFKTRNAISLIPTKVTTPKK